ASRALRRPRPGSASTRCSAALRISASQTCSPGGSARRSERAGSAALFAAALEALAELFAAAHLVAGPLAALLHVLAETGLEAVRAAAVDALGEVGLNA